MNATHELLARASSSLWPALADHLWQATLFAGLVLLLALLLRRAPARQRHALWLVASLKFALPAALFAALARLSGLDASLLFGADTSHPAPLVYQFVAEPLSRIAVAATAGGAPHNELYCALTLVWLAGCALLSCAWAWRRREFVRGLRGGRESYWGREFDAVERARSRLKLRRDVRLVLSEGRAGPGVWRTLAPVVVLPEALASELNDEELEAVLLHELAHAERRDNFWSNLQAALSCVFWFDPAVWLIGRRLLAERERACDERVLECGGRAEAYASGILKVVRFCSGWGVAGVAGAAGGSNLGRRIESIMQGNTRKGTRARGRLLVISAASAAFAFSALAGLFGAAGGSVASARQSAGGQQQQQQEGASRVITTRAGAGTRRRGVQGPAAREIESAQESVVYFGDAAAGAPVAITDARMRLITREQLRRADEEGADFFDEDEASAFFVTLPSVTVANYSAKQVKEVGVAFVVNGKTKVMTGHAASIGPGESQTFRADWRGHNVIIPGTPADVSLRIAWVSFTDGTSWGVRMPEPAAPGAPAARARTPQAEGGSGAGGPRAKAIEVPEPSYPAIARAANAEGEVRVRVTIGEDGRVVAAKAVSGHPLLLSAAVDAARAARFEPTFVDGRPVKVSALLSYRFDLSNEDRE